MIKFFFLYLWTKFVLNRFTSKQQVFQRLANSGVGSGVYAYTLIKSLGMYHKLEVLHYGNRNDDGLHFGITANGYVFKICEFENFLISQNKRLGFDQGVGITVSGMLEGFGPSYSVLLILTDGRFDNLFKCSYYQSKKPKWSFAGKLLAAL